MKIKANRKEMLKSLKTVSGAVGSRSILAILNNVLLETIDGGIFLTATDLEKRITAFCPCEVEEAGQTTLPAKKLSSVIDAMTGEDIQIEVPKTHQAQISCGKTQVRMPGIAPADFPEAAVADFESSIAVDMADLRTAAKASAYAVATDNSRIVLTGVLMQVKGNTVHFVGTDGKRLAVSEIPQLVEHEKDFQVIIPVHALNFLASLNTEKVEMFFGNNKFFAKIGDISYWCKTIEGNFPNWQGIIPSSFRHELQIPRDILLQKLALQNVVSAELYAVSVTVEKEKLLLNCNNAVNGSANDEMEISGCSLSEPQKFMFNPVFLVSAVQSASGDVFTLKFNDNTNPVMLDFNNGSRAVIMPIRMK